MASYTFDKSKEIKVVLFNNRSRSQEDASIEEMKNALLRIGVKIDDISLIDAHTKLELMNQMEQISKSNLKKYNCLICIMSSSGDYGVLDVGKDETIQVDELVRLFWADKAGSHDLAGKPKLFLFQACNHDVYSLDVPDGDSGRSKSFPAQADILSAWSLLPISYSKIDGGKPYSLFLKHIADVLNQCKTEGVKEIDMIKELTRISGLVSDDMMKITTLQSKERPGELRDVPIPVVISMLTKKFLLPIQ